MATFYFLLESDGTSKLLKEDADYLVGETHVAAGAGGPPSGSLSLMGVGIMYLVGIGSSLWAYIYHG